MSDGIEYAGDNALTPGQQIAALRARTGELEGENERLRVSLAEAKAFRREVQRDGKATAADIREEFERTVRGIKEDKQTKHDALWEKTKAARARVAELEELQAHRDHSPCAIRILREFYSDEEAHGIALELTCFPMDCETASRQAVEFLERVNRLPEGVADEG